jgi:Asp-tRNA(Asn)/Glu-tRNA(Gln) amidotransferase A subunit family amidase
MSDYDLESVNLPKLKGAELQLFASALDNPITYNLLIGQLLKNGGVFKLREIQLSEPPTVFPIYFTGNIASGPIPPARIDRFASRQKSKGPYRTVKDYAAAYRAGTTTPEAVAIKVLEAIAESEKSNLPLRAFISINKEDVLSQARVSTQRIKAGKPISLFDGVPIAIKDEVDMVPYPTTAGTIFMGDQPAAEDSTVVARLRAAGALLIGKANMHEIGINPNGCNAHYGPARNPHNPDYDSGGSSSGPSAAVAAGFCPVAIGADGGGSIRIPAGLCGLVGLKATFGRVSEKGAAPLCWSVGHIGPIGASVEDVALTYGLIAGPDQSDPNSLHQPPVKLDGWNNPNLKGLTFGVYWPWFRHATAEIVSCCEAMLEQLVKAGATVREIEVPELDAQRIAHVVTILSEMAASMENYKEHYTKFAPSVRVTLAAGKAFTSRDYVQAQRMRTRAMAFFRKIYESVDVIITPGTAITAPKIPITNPEESWSDLSADTETMRFIVPGNLVGLPAISFPAGYDKSGLPISMHAMGRPWQEDTLLRVAYAAEQIMDRKLPQVYYQILP